MCDLHGVDFGPVTKLENSGTWGTRGHGCVKSVGADVIANKAKQTGVFDLRPVL